MEQSNNTPLAAVVVPVYKAEALLRRCLNSILAQTWTNWAAILVDDGSPDASGAICDEYAARDARFCVIHQPNGGLPAARNAGLDALPAEARYVFFADADDALSPITFETGLRLARMFPGEPVSWDYTSEAAELAAECPEQPLIEEYPADRLLDYYFTWNLSPVWCKVFPASVFTRDGMRFEPDMRFAEDTIFTLSYLERCFDQNPGCRLHYLRLPLYYYDTVSNPGSLCHTVGADYCKYQYILLPAAIRFFERLGYSQPALERLYHRYVQAVCCGLDNIQNTPPPEGRRAALHKALAHPELGKMLDYFAQTGVYSAYYLPLRLHWVSWALLLFHSQQTEQKFWYWKFYWLGWYAWRLFRKPPAGEAP